VNDYRPGCHEDFERLYQSSYSKVLGTLIKILCDRAAAEDCTQDAFERAYRNWHAWRPDAPAEAWVHRIAVNAAISYQRKMRVWEVGEVIRRLGQPGAGPDPPGTRALRPHRRDRRAATEAGGHDRASLLPRPYQPRDLAGHRDAGAYGLIATRAWQATAPGGTRPELTGGGMKCLLVEDLMSESGLPSTFELTRQEVFDLGTADRPSSDTLHAINSALIANRLWFNGQGAG
jgi:RNA polymerase sigma factor (sigma-70 family)